MSILAVSIGFATLFERVGLLRFEGKHRLHDNRVGHLGGDHRCEDEAQFQLLPSPLFEVGARSVSKWSVAQRRFSLDGKLPLTH